jgi:hypothetical protein
VDKAPSRKSRDPPTEPKTPRASSDSTRKRRRSKVPTGPKAPIPRRRSSVPIRRKGQDLISFHRQSCRLFQSLEGTLASSQDWTNAITPQQHARHASIPTTNPPPSQCIVKTDNGFAYLKSTPSTPRYGNSPRTSRRNSSAVTPPKQFYNNPSPSTPSTAPNTTSSSFSSLAGTSSSTLHEKAAFDLAPSRPHPVSIISWTSTESRRLEYEKIDRSHSGLRGLWKKTMPRWCHGRHTRRGFFDGKSSDAGSVRRYRIDLDDEEGEDQRPGKYGNESDDTVDEKQLSKGSRREVKRSSRWRWSCMRFASGKYD